MVSPTKSMHTQTFWSSTTALPCMHLAGMMMTNRSGKSQPSAKLFHEDYCLHGPSVEDNRLRTEPEAP